jgi:hypothetical protein
MTTFSTLVGNEQPGDVALAKMRKRGGDWFAYQNHELGHPGLGHLQFMQCGKGCTYETPPGSYPEALGWRYLPVGKVNLATGLIEEVDHYPDSAGDNAEEEDQEEVQDAAGEEAAGEEEGQQEGQQEEGEQ